PGPGSFADPLPSPGLSHLLAQVGATSTSILDVVADGGRLGLYRGVLLGRPYAGVGGVVGLLAERLGSPGEGSGQRQGDTHLGDLSVLGVAAGRTGERGVYPVGVVEVVGVDEVDEDQLSDGY